MIFVNLADVVQLTNAPSISPLENDFKHPPSSAYPQVYWFWMNGNVTKEGITLDLEAMKQVGVGGAEQCRQRGPDSGAWWRRRGRW